MPPRIILVRTKEAANVGSVARVMKNFGFERLVLVAPRCRLDARAYALASHAGELLERAVIRQDLAAAVHDCTVVLGMTARQRSATDYRVLHPSEVADWLPAVGGALVFGPEDHGLSNAELDRCQAYLRIPTGGYPSLNLAQAVNIVVYEWFVRSSAPATSSRREEDLAERRQYEAMYAQLLELFHLIGFTDGQRQAGIAHLFRRIFDRAELSSREVAALRGLWSQAEWAARQPPEQLPGCRSR